MHQRLYLMTGCILASLGMAAPAGAETLIEAMAHAYNSNPTLLAARSALRATDESVPQALSGWRPSVSIVGEAGHMKTETKTTSTSASSDLNPWSVQIQVQQPLYTGGRVSASVRNAENTVLAGRASLMNTEQTVLLNVATAYMNVLRDEALLELNRKNVEVLKRQLQAAQDRFRVGEITRTDVAQAEARLANAVSDRISSEGTLETTRATYLAVVGRSPSDLKTPELSINFPPNSAAASEAAALNNPSVVTARYNAEAARAGVDQITGELLPTVNLNLAAGRSKNQSIEGYQTSFAEATISISVPLYQAGSVSSRVREQKHTANQRRIQIHEQRRSAIQAATQAYETWLAAKASIESLQTQIEASQIALEGVEREAQVGARTVLDVLDAEQELLSARVSLVSAERNERVSAFQILQAMGRLTATDLSLPVEVYNPVINYEDVRGAWFGTGANLIPEPQ